MAKYPPILITGTDTGVGKTHAGRRMAAAFHARGISVGVFKPLESGWPEGGAGSDADLLLKAASSKQTLDDVCLYRLKTPVAPAVAARIDGVEIDVEKILRHLRGLSSRFDIVLVEGAGGLLTPLAKDWNILDLAVKGGMHALVVVANKLGCVNHALLTDFAMKQAGVERIGFVMNAIPGAFDESRKTNAELIASLTGLPVYDINDGDFTGRILSGLGPGR